LLGRWRRDADAGRGIARLALFADRETGSVPVVVVEAKGVGTDWSSFSVDLVTPPGTLYAQVQLVHALPTRGDSGEVIFSDVELLEWSGAVSAGEVIASGASYAAIEASGPGQMATATLDLASTPKVKP
jgi:hypothetical protein